MREVISFLNNNVHKISHLEENDSVLIIHMTNGDTIEFFGKSGIVANHYKYV